MKKILHLFSDPSHSALWSRYLRMLTLIVLFAFGSHGVWGETKSVSLENMTPSDKGTCTWDADTRTLSWEQGYYNHIGIPNLTGDLSLYYDGNIIFSYSGLSEGATFRVMITKKVNNVETTYQYLVPATDGTEKDVVVPIKDFAYQSENNEIIKITADDLKSVLRIALAGSSNKGSVKFGTTFTITTSSSAMAMSMKGFQHTSGNEEAQWDAKNLKFSWTQSWNNFLDLWKYSNLEDLSAYYGGSFIYKASKISDNDDTKHRLIIRCYAEDGSNKKDFLYASDNATVDYTTIPLSEFKDNSTSISPTDLKNVKKIMILGNSSSGALTLGETFTLVAKEDKYKSGIIDAKVGDRNYQIYVPAGITETSGLKLLFTLHGRGNSYKFTENGVPNFQTQADNDKNVVIVSPQGKDNVWNAYTDKSNPVQIASYNTDFEFLKSIILALTKTGTDNPTYNGIGQVTIDRTKVFTVGFSNGGMMSYALVTNNPDVFAAGGSVSGLPVNQYALHKSNGHPVPFIHFQGKGDTYVRYEQSAQHIKNWVAYNGCGSVNTTTGKYDVNDNTSDYHVEYNSGKVPFHFYGVKEAGHIPNMTYNGTSSSQLIWDFIKDRTLGGNPVGNPVDMTVVWCPELSVLNSYSSKAWGGIEDKYVETNDENATGNQGVNDRICFEKGRHQLRFTANGTVKIKIYKKGAASAILYKQNTVFGSETGFKFDITEAGDYIVEINRSTGATFSDFGIYKLDLPIESTILENSKVPTISNGVATYSGVSSGQSTVKYLNVDMTNYKSVSVDCSFTTGNSFSLFNNTKGTQLSSGGNTINDITSGEMTIVSLGGTSIDINYFRLAYNGTFDEGKDAEDANDNVNAVAMYDLSQITSETKNGTCIGVSYDSENKVATFTKKDQYDNLVDLDKGRKGAVGSGIRFHYMGSSFRVMVTVDGVDHTCTIPENNSIYWATRHLSWKDDFKLSNEQISKIARIRIGGTSEDANPDEFKIQHIWFDDVNDYNKTFVCYGYEQGMAIENNSKYQYTLGTAKATFSNFGWGNFQGGTMYLKIPASGTVTISNDEPNTKYTDIKLFFDKGYDSNLTCDGTTYSAKEGFVELTPNKNSFTITNNGSDVYLSKIEFNTSYEVLDKFTLDNRNYWLYVPSSAANKKDVPVIFSLHGKQTNSANPTGGTDAPNFHSISNNNGVIIVLPEGRKIYDNNTCYGWEANGEENEDTKFIQALVKEIQTKYASQSSSNGYISVDPKRFYLCGFSEGGSMTYACAKVLNGTFAAYGSCGGFPLNEFHLNLATKQPVPFIHLHGDADNVVEIKHLHTIIENLLFRNGCSLAGHKTANEKGWTTTKDNGETHDFKRYDFTGVNGVPGVPVTTVTFNGLWHSVEASAPKYLWDFFSPKTLDTYKPTTMKWQWDMTTINSNLSASNGYPYGWKRVTDAKPTYLTYGDNRNTGNTGNHNVYNSIQLEKGTYKLHAKANVLQSDDTGITVGIYKVGAKENSGTCIIRRKVVNNSSAASNNLSILYPFVITDDGEYYVKVERGNSQNTCTALAIHTSDYAPDDEDDSENAMTLNAGWETDGLIVKIDFEDVGNDCENIGEEMTATNHTDNFSFVQFKEDAPESGYKLYNLHRADNIQTWDKSAVIQNDEIFDNYFQNIPKAQFYDRSAGQNYMRAVLPKGALKPIKESGAATIGFWVNGRVAVDAGLSYNDASMLYLSGPYHSNHCHPTGDNGKEDSHTEYQSMFNIRCNGHTNGFLKNYDENGKSKQVRYYAQHMFGDLCDNSEIDKYYKKNLYLDRNWHYITMVMYNDLRNVDMYVDGEQTHSRQNIVGSDQNLKAGLDSINHIIIGGLNATYSNFAYDPAFAFDDIVIYSRALSAQEIQAIITAKKYSPNSWDFEKNIANTALLDEKKLTAGGYWTYDKTSKVYTLNKKLDTAAELTYDGNRVIPAFRGLKFQTTGTDQIQIDMAKKRLIVVKGIVNMTISNAPAGQYIRYEYDSRYKGWLDAWNNQDFIGDIWPSDTTKIGITNVSGTGRQTCKCTVHGTLYFKSIGSTDKIYTDLCFGSIKDAIVDGKTRPVFTPTPKVTVETEDFSFTEPTLHLIFNGFNNKNEYNSQVLAYYKDKIKFWSSAPHVAYINKIKDENQPEVKVTGVPGSAYIYAELENNNQYDCNTADKDLYASSNRILARYEIHVPNSVPGYSVKISADENHNDDNHKFIVGDVLKTTDNAVTLTLGGWNYNSNSYFGSTDGYTKKEKWEGMPLNKTKNDPNGYLSEYNKLGTYTDDNTYSGLGFYTGGTYAAKSEQLNDTGNKGLFYTESVKNNSTAWTLPCRGSYAKVEPTEAGIISVYVLQEGCMERNMTGEKQTYFDSYEVAANEPYDINIKKVYVADEAGKIIDDVITDTKSKIVSQVWKDDGRARAEYSYYMIKTAYSELLHNRFLTNIVNAEENPVALLDKWNSPGMTQNIIPYRKGYAVIDKGVVRYTFNVLPGKTYYIFSNDAKMGIAGFNFTKDKQLNFNSKHEIIANDPLAELTRTESVSLNDGDDYSVHTEKNANVTLNRKFYKNYWNAICLPYSINRRQIEDQFGNGTMVVLMDNINTSTKKVMFIEHANQDIIAGYPYLIFPTKKDDKDDPDKTDHSVIDGITTRATFGEANSPLFSVGTDGKTYTPGNMQQNALVFKGTFSKEDLPVGSYVITKSGTLANVQQTGLTINPYRAYIHFNKTTSEAKAIKLASMGFAGFDDMEGETTSIEDLLFNDGIMTRPADVFTVNGQKVRSKAENLYGLPKGVYIVNGKKYVNK